MIKTLYEIGKVLKEHEDYADYFEPWARPFKGAAAGNAKVIVFHVSGGMLQGEATIEDYSAGLIDKYLYLRAPAMSTNVVPTFLFLPKNKPDELKKEIEKRVQKKMKASFKNYKHTFLHSDEIAKIEAYFLNANLDTKLQYLFTFKIDGLYLGEIPELRTLFIENAYGKFYQASSAKDYVCALTGEKAKMIYGRVSTLGFAVTDPSFSRSGFDTKDSYKMFPVSEEACKILEGMNRLAEEFFAFSFHGYKYYVLPHFIQVPDESKEDIIRQLLKFPNTPNNDVQIKGIISNEQITNEIAENDNFSKSQVYFDVFFYKRNSNQYLILSHISDVAPSRFSRIKKSMDVLSAWYKPITYHQSKDGKESTFYPNLYSLARWFSHKIKNNTETVFHPIFFQVVNGIFHGTILNEKNILDEYLNIIRPYFKDKDSDWYFQAAVKESFVTHMFLQSLNLFTNKQYTQNMNEKPDLTMDGFIAQHAHFFDSEYKKGVFMLGALSQILMQKQYQKLKSDPFRKNLNGLNIDEGVVKDIFPKLINKMREYELAVPDTESAIAQALVHKANIGRSEISYLFTLGMIMQREFSKQYQNKQQ